MTDSNIYHAAKACRRTFAEAKNNPCLMHDEWAERRFADFNLWAASEGVFAPGKASLDERLLLEPEAKEMITNLIKMLEILVQVSIERANDPERVMLHVDKSDAEYIDTGEEPNPTVLQSLKDVEDVLDQLIRVTHAIRRAGSRSRLRKADISFRRRLPELLPFRRHLELVLLARPSANGTPVVRTSEIPEDEVKVQVVGPSDLDPLENDVTITPIQSRLIEANLRRRNRFLYAQIHSRKLAVERRKKGKELPKQPNEEALQPRRNYNRGECDTETIATEPADNTPSAPDDNPVQADELKSTTTATQLDGPLVLPPVQQEEPTMTAISSTGLHIKYPNPSPVTGGEGGFKCPCCCQYLPLKFSRGNSWRKHLATDIMPYTCVLAACPFPEELYVSREGWERHMERDHSSTSQWTCHACLEPQDRVTFHMKEDFTSHLEQEHHEKIKPQQINMLISLWSRKIAAKVEHCPVCGKTETLDHTAKHVHAFSLRSLPWGNDNYFKSSPYFADTSEGSRSGDGGTSSSDEEKMENLPALDGSETSEAEDAPLNNIEMTEKHVRHLPEQFIGEQDVAGWRENVLTEPPLGDVGEETDSNVDERPDYSLTPSATQTEHADTDKEDLSKRLIEAATQGKDEEVEHLIDQQGVQPDCKDDKNYTPLLHAASKGHEKVVSLLLNTGKVDLNVKGDENGTPLSSASRCGRRRIVQLLLEHGAKVDLLDSEFRTPLDRAAARGKDEIVKLLLDHGADIDSPRGAKHTPLTSAARNGRAKTVELLLQKGADIAQLNGFGKTALDRAAAYGHGDIVKILLDHDLDIYSSPKRVNVALIEAVRKSQLQIVDLLLHRGADIESSECSNKFPLEHAAAHGAKEIAQLLLAKHTGSNLQTKILNRALIEAIKNDHIQIVILLLAKRADIKSLECAQKTPLEHAAAHGNEEITKFLLARYDESDFARGKISGALCEAISNGHLHIAQLLLENRANVQLPDALGRVPLEYAASRGIESIVKTALDQGVDSKEKVHDALVGSIDNGHTHIVKLMLERGVDVNFLTDSQSPLDRATVTGQLEIVRLLLDSGANVHGGKGRVSSLLHGAIKHKHLRIAQLLVSYGADLNSRNEDGKAALHLAAEKGYDKAAAMLCDAGADINKRTRNKKTPLHLAAEKGHSAMVQLLISRGAQVDTRDSTGLTPFHSATKATKAIALSFLECVRNTVLHPKARSVALTLAAREGQCDTIQIILDQGEDINAKDWQGRTALFWAVNSAVLDAVQLLLDRGADVNCQPTTGQTILAVAAKKGQSDIAKMLLEAGAHPNVQDNGRRYEFDQEGTTPLYWAVMNGHEEVAELLLGHGADANLQNPSWGSILSVAKRSGHSNLVEVLNKYGAT